MPVANVVRHEGGPSKLKVFLSYSRKDSAFAQELLAALELLGFDAYLDKEDIAPGEPWEERLGSLIRLADTVVFIISPFSLSSSHCTWEVEETARAAKRLVPVMLAAVADADVPERLRKLNYVFFSPGLSFSKGLGDLAQALRADASWIREHTRYGEMAGRWIERGRPDALLLRASDLDDAKRWAAERPAAAPEISANQQGYIEASSKIASEELRAQARLRWRVQVGLGFVSLALAALSGFSLWQWRATETAKVALAESNIKLERKLALRAAPRGYLPFDVPAGWFQVAAKYAGAVAFVEKRATPDRITATGVIVSARLLNPRWDEKPVFVTASYVVAKDHQRYEKALSPVEALIVMLGPKNERRTARLGAIIWQSDVLGVSVSSIEDGLPTDVTVLKAANVRTAALDGLAALTKAEVDALFDANGMLHSNTQPRPIVFVGNLLGRKEVVISISHLLGHLTQAGPGNPKGIPNVLTPVDGGDGQPSERPSGQPSERPFGQSRGIDAVPIPDELRTDIVYTHGTLPGGGGSPIFDAETGDLIGIHLMGYQCPPTVPAGRRCAAAGTSLPRLLAAIQAE